MRAKTQNVQQGAQETTGVGETRKKTVWNRDMRRSVEGMGWGTRVNKMDATGTSRKESREFEGGGLGVD